MIEYRVDKNPLYSETIKKMLRAHNLSHTGPVELEERHFYITENKKLLGALSVHFFWDWVTVGDVYYESLPMLRALIRAAWEHFKHKAVGIKFFTPVESRFQDFLESGFSAVATVRNVGGFDYYFADLNATSDDDGSIQVQSVSDFQQEQEYHTQLKQHTRSFNEHHGIKGMTDSVQIVAVEGETFVGGVQCDVYTNTMFITRLVVDPAYRKRDIGKTLVEWAVREAQKRKVDVVELGTTGFQGREFYEKQGFQVVHTRKDNPKGYDCHTMLRRL